MENTPFLGALVDNREQVEKDKDYKFEEIVASASPVNWVKKSECRRFPIFDQNGSSSCVAQSIAKIAGIMYAEQNEGSYVHFSATDVYQRRSNRPGEGMIGVNAFDIAREGITLEELAPSQKMTDAQMDAYKIAPYKQAVGKIFKFGNYVVLPNNDIDLIASTIHKTGKGVMVWFYFTYAEWTKDMPTIDGFLDLYSAKAIRHSVVAVDFTLLPDGRKALIIEDSWGHKSGFEGQRIITEDFFKNRNFFNAYPINFMFGSVDSEKPQYTFEKDLTFSTKVTYTDEVKELQKILKFEGFFPENIETTGYYGAVTAKAVLDYQLKYMTDYAGYPESLKTLKGRIVGPSTRAHLNSKYGN